MISLQKYQEQTLDRLDDYLDALTTQKRELKSINKTLYEQGHDVLDYCSAAWKSGGLGDDYISRKDKLGRPIPNVCFKVPTGGGKTLLGVEAVRSINRKLFTPNTGLILWVVPSKAIYAQTLKAFKDPDHYYRRVLRHAAANRLKVVRHTDNFSKSDVENGLVVMLVMQQAFSRKEKESLRMFNERGGFIDFFPYPEEYDKNHRYKNIVPNLDTFKISNERLKLHPALMIKPSLANVLRLERPLIVIDEAHKTRGKISYDAICDLNPRFILELSATPDATISNTLVDISGYTLKQAEMIKLPICLYNKENSDWKTTLDKAWAKTQELDELAKQHKGQSNDYIRPILLVRVEVTGKAQIGKGKLHVEDARRYLIEKLGIPPEFIRRKTSQEDEIKDENLLSEESQTRVIITHSALQEGWDCSFAYVLALLSKTTAPRAMTQMTGRILRQPYARTTGIEELDRAHIFCFDQNVSESVQKVCTALEREGLGDLKSNIAYGEDLGEPLVEREIKRRAKFEDKQITMPYVLYKDGKKLRDLDYDRDILRHLPWEKFEFSKKDNFELRNGYDSAEAESTIDIKEDGIEAASPTIDRIAPTESVNAAFFARGLADTMPNAWQAARIGQATLDAFKKRKFHKDNIYAQRYAILDAIKNDIEKQIDEKAENVFCDKLQKNIIQCKVQTGSDQKHNFEIEKLRKIRVSEKDQVFNKESGRDIQHSLFEDVYEKEFGSKLEENVARFLDNDDIVSWWHRIAARQDEEYNLQGWRRHKIYPDFIAKIIRKGEKPKILAALEAKGEHLEGNKDTEYKKKFFCLLEKVNKNNMVFRVISEREYEQDILQIRDT